MQTCSNIELSNETELSKYIWDMKNNNEDFTIEWKIQDKAKPYQPGNKHCNLRISEKYAIITALKVDEKILSIN